MRVFGDNCNSIMLLRAFGNFLTASCRRIKPFLKVSPRKRGGDVFACENGRGSLHDAAIDRPKACIDARSKAGKADSDRRRVVGVTAGSREQAAKRHAGRVHTEQPKRSPFFLLSLLSALVCQYVSPYPIG